MWVSVADPNQNKDFGRTSKSPRNFLRNIWMFPKYLCIAFGILFLVMLLVNVYLCCAITGSAKICCFPGSGTKDKSFDKRGSSNKPDEFDPYARSWHGSQYGSRWVPSIFLTTCITKVLRFPRARCTIFFSRYWICFICQLFILENLPYS